MPSASSPQAQRVPKYVSAGTKSVSVQVGGGNTPSTFSFNVTPSSQNCVSSSTGVSCTEQIDAPVGSDVFSVNAYDDILDSNGTPQGNLLARGSAYQAVTEGIANTVKITLMGVPATATVALGNASPADGATTTTPVTISVQDADGYTVVGSYANPVEFPCNPTSLQPWLSTTVNGSSGTWIGTSADTITLTYIGQGIQSATLQACLVGNESTVLGSVQFKPQPSFGTETPVDASLDGATAYVDVPQSIVFTEPSKSRFATLAQGASEPLYYPIASGAEPLRMTPRSGSEMYFTLSDNAIGEYNFIDGALVEHALPTANAGLYGLGGQWYYDFSVWFTEHDAGKIGMLGTLSTSYGHITEYSIGNAKSTPAGMAPGGGGFFFADPGTNSIGSVVPSTSGAAPSITEYPLATASAQPMEITGPDSNERSWFTERAASKVGRISSSGHIDEFPSSGVPIAIQYVSGAVFTLTSTHTIERYDIQTGSQTVITPPSSANGPVVGLADGGFDTLLVLRGNGSTGALQNYYF